MAIIIYCHSWHYFIDQIIYMATIHISHKAKEFIDQNLGFIRKQFQKVAQQIQQQQKSNPNQLHTSIQILTQYFLDCQRAISKITPEKDHLQYLTNVVQDTKEILKEQKEIRPLNIGLSQKQQSISLQEKPISFIKYFACNLRRITDNSKQLEESISRMEKLIIQDVGQSMGISQKQIQEVVISGSFQFQNIIENPFNEQPVIEDLEQKLLKKKQRKSQLIKYERGSIVSEQDRYQKINEQQLKDQAFSQESSYLGEIPQRKTVQECLDHKGKIYYLCLGDIQKSQVYFCNQCIEAKQKMARHYKHQIICQKHRRPIRYKLRLQQNQVSELKQIQNHPQPRSQILKGQIFMCEQCLDRDQNYFFVSCCHYEAVTNICIEQKCIKEDEFMLCPTCLANDDKHETHQKIGFDFKSLEKQFALANLLNTAQQDQYLFRIKEILKLNLFQKIKVSYAQKIWPTSRFLESFDVYSNQKVQQRIECLVKDGKKEDLMVLRGFLSIKEQNEVQRANYLESLHILAEAEIQEMFQLIGEMVSKCCKKISLFRNIEEDRIAEVLNKKDRQITEIEKDDKLIISPSRIYDISTLQHNRIQKITIIKDREQQREQRIEIDWRKARGKFYKDLLKKKMFQGQISKNLQIRIIESFINTENYQTMAQQIESNDLQQQNNQQKIFKILIKKYRSINRSFLAELENCLPWAQIFSHKFINLKSIHIQYSNYKYFTTYFRKYCYSIDAFEFFKFINENPQLESVSIKEIKLLNMEQLLDNLDMIPFERLQKLTEKTAWMRLIQPWKHIRLSLDWKYYIGNKSNKNLEFPILVRKLQSFCHQFSYISDITIKIMTNGISEVDIKNLLNCLRRIKRIKLQFAKSNYLLKQLLEGLTSFKEITSLTFQNVKINFSLQQYQEIEEKIAEIFNNNTITHLSLDTCRNFPALPEITTLQLIRLQKTQFIPSFAFNLDQFINANKDLKSIHFRKINYQCQIKGQLLGHIYYLVIQDCKDVILDTISSLQTFRLKYLHISIQQIPFDSLQGLLSKLVYLSQLRLQSFDFSYQNLCHLPSPYLEAIYIENNKLITNLDLERIDQKWPYLRYLQLSQCILTNQKILEHCKFKSLMEIGINNCDKSVFTASAKKYLKIRGIQIIQRTKQIEFRNQSFNYYPKQSQINQNKEKVQANPLLQPAISLEYHDSRNNFDSILKIQMPASQDSQQESQVSENEFGRQLIIESQPLNKISKQELNLPLHQVIVAMTVPIGNTINKVFGSGVLLSKNIVLTAASNIFFKLKEPWEELNKSECRVYLQSDGKRYYEVEDWKYLKQFTTANKANEAQFDYAIIKLKGQETFFQRITNFFHSFSNANNFLQVCLPCQCILKKQPSAKLNIYGYLLEEDNYVPLKQGQSIKLSQLGLTKKDSIISVEPYFQIKYTVSTMPGQSGSPIIFGSKIIGIHTAGVQNQYKFGRLVTKDLIIRIKDWCKQLKGDPIRINQSAECPRCKREVNALLQQTTQEEKIKQANELKGKGDMKREAYQFEESMNYYTLALEKYQRVKGKGCFQSASTLHQMGLVYSNQLNYTKALEYYSQALEIKEKVKGKGCFESASTLHCMGSVYYYQLNYTKALEYYSLALEIKEKVKGKGCFQSASTLHQMGLVYYDQLNYTKALEYYSQALEIFQRVKGKGCFQSASTLHCMGSVYDDQLNYTKALEYYSLALEIKERVKGKGCFQSAVTLNNMAVVYSNQLNYTKALEYYSLALEIREKVKGKGCFQSAATLHQMGLVYSNQLNYTKALEYYSLALEIYQRVKGKGCFESAVTLNNMAVVYSNQLNYTKALEYYSLALEIYQRVKGKGCFESAVTLYNMGFVYSSLNNHEAAVQSFSSSLPIYEKYSRETDARDCAIQLAKSLKKLKKQAQMSQIAAKYGLAANEI